MPGSEPSGASWTSSGAAEKKSDLQNALPPLFVPDSTDLKHNLAFAIHVKRLRGG